MSALMQLIQPLQTALQRSGLASRWQHLPPRDRLALAGLGLFLLLALLYLLLWLPAAQRVEQARSHLQQQRSLHQYLQEHAGQVRGRQGRPTVSLDPAALQGLLTASAGSQGLVIERVDNQGDGGVQVSLQPTDFARLLRWLVSLEEQGVRVDEAGLERADKGLVSSRLLLRSGA
ncbi:general secretion pathway protein GspM [Pseudomonas alcaligenes]|uniref:Type II secretion system protein M n=1 Tax=Aquipseudomonas alcaligenes TaxID=43263 RepID=A0ABR7RXN7_AQUAC|nr:type II secretion system protein M [Pseudomonas alcaligenes]MBC9250107.1 general secretion pathway protein GspM [Pseudomonas alcaligenes]